nr:hypothetical protein [Tanacetum cinerariifolium]
MNGPYVRRVIPEPGDADREVPVYKTFHEQKDDELTENELKQVEVDDQAIQTILLSSDIGIQEKKAKLFNEWERFTSTDGESIEYYYHRFLKVMNDFKRNKHFPEKIASNLKFLNNLQPEWSQHVTIVHQTKDLHTTDYTQLYDFLKYNKKEVDELRAERLRKTHNPLALMANNPFNYLVFHQDQSSLSTYMQQPQPNNKYNLQPSFNQNYMQQLMPNPKDIFDPTTAMNMALILMAKAFKLNYLTPTNNNQRISLNLRNRQIAQPGMNMGQDRYRWLEAMVGISLDSMLGRMLGIRMGIMQYKMSGIRLFRMYLKSESSESWANVIGNNDLNEIEKVNSNYILMANLQQASTSGTQTDKAPIYDSYGSAELSKEKSIVSSLLEEKKKLKSDFKICEDELIDKQIQLENKIKELDNILVNGMKFSLLLTNDARLQNFKIQFLKEAAKFVRDFKSLAKEAVESLANHKALELEIERLLRAVVSRDIMSIMQSNSVIDTSNLQTELDRMKERFENCIIKKENEYAKLWNDWYKKCEECKYDKISYAKAYNDMQQNIRRLQAQLGDQRDITKGMSVNTQFCKQLILGKPPSSSGSKLYAVTPFPKSKGLLKIDETHALSTLVNLNSGPTPQESKVVKNDNVIAPGMFRINPFKPSREDKSVPNKVRARVRIKPINVSQPHVITKKDVNSNSHVFSSTGVENTAKTKRLQPRNNTKNYRVFFASKSSCSKNKEVKVEEHPRNLLLSKNKKHMSSECNNVKLAIRNDKSEVVCAMCKQCLITANHDVCVLIYVNGMNSTNISNTENQKKQKPKVMKPKKVGSNERLASPNPINLDLALGGHQLEDFLTLKEK